MSSLMTNGDALRDVISLVWKRCKYMCWLSNTTSTILISMTEQQEIRMMISEVKMKFITIMSQHQNWCKSGETPDSDGRVLSRRNLFSKKIVKHDSQAGVRWRIFAIRDIGLRDVVDESDVWEKKCQWSAWEYPDNSLSRRKRNVSSWTAYWLHLRRSLKDCHFDDRISQIEMKVEMTLRLCLASPCLDFEMSTYSTYCCRSTTIPKSPLVRNLFPSNQNVKMFQISKRKSYCCCCKWVKLGGAEDQRLQYCVFLVLLIGIRDVVNFCTVEYFHLYFFSEQNFACICPFTLSCNGGIDHSNPIYLRLSLFLRFIRLPRTRLHLAYAQHRTSVAIWISASLRHSNVTPRASFWNGSTWLPQGRLLHLLSRTTGDLSWTTSVTWSTSIDSSRSSDCDSVNMSMSSCHVVLWDFQLLYLIWLPFPDLCLSILLVSLIVRTRSVGFFKEPNGLLSTFRCYGNIVRFDSFIFPDIFFDVVYAWRLEYVERFPNLGLSIITKWTPRFVVFGFFDVGALSETDGFVMSTGLFVGTCQMETSTRRISADLLCDDLSILSRSVDPLHRHRPLSWIYSPCRWVTTLMRTESGRLYLIFMRGSLMWTGSEMSQMSFSPHVWSRRLCPFDFCHMSWSDDDTLTLHQVRFDA